MEGVVLSASNPIDVPLEHSNYGDTLRMRGKVLSSSDDSLRWAFNLCCDSFSNCVLHLVFNTKEVLVTSRYNGSWLGSPGWKLPVPDGLYSEFEITATFMEDGIHLQFNGAALTNPVPYGDNYNVSDINLLKLTGQYGELICFIAEKVNSRQKSARK